MNSMMSDFAVFVFVLLLHLHLLLHLILHLLLLLHLVVDFYDFYDISLFIKLEMQGRFYKKIK